MEKLQEAHQLQLFKANQRLLLEWSVKQSSEMAEKCLPKTRAEAERLIVEHQDWKVSRLCRTSTTKTTSTSHDHSSLTLLFDRRRSTPVLSVSSLFRSLAWV